MFPVDLWNTERDYLLTRHIVAFQVLDDKFL